MADTRAGPPAASTAESGRPAFYALSPGGWRDLVTILHPPYTAWHLSYVALGAAVAPELHAVRLWAALGAFFLAVGIAAHALDELHGHPLGTRLSDRALAMLAGMALIGAVGIGIAGVFVVSPTLLPFIAAGAFAVLAYNLELFGGRFHTDLWFAAAWGAFPALTGYWVNALGIPSVETAIAAIAVTALDPGPRASPTHGLGERYPAPRGWHRERAHGGAAQRPARRSAQGALCRGGAGGRGGGRDPPVGGLRGP
jgi:hypothetical protein